MLRPIRTCIGNVSRACLRIFHTHISFQHKKHLLSVPLVTLILALCLLDSSTVLPPFIPVTESFTLTDLLNLLNALALTLLGAGTSVDMGL